MSTLIVTLLVLLCLTLAAVQVIDIVYESDQQVAERALPVKVIAPRDDAREIEEQIAAKERAYQGRKGSDNDPQVESHQQ